ncbi:MAG: dipeptidyl aminopeptidase [Burkholderiaceae bacterium]
MPSPPLLPLPTALYLCIATALASTASHAAAPSRTSDPAPSLVQIRVPAQSGSPAGPGRTMYTQVFKPPGPGPFPVLLYAHGRPAFASERALLKRPIHARHVQYWLAKGYAVVAPIRPGYGITGGADAESSGVGYAKSGACLRSPNPANLTVNAAAAQRRALDWARQQPWARKDRIVLEGHSAGGLATVALCAANPLGVVGCINFSGGAGGDPVHAPGRLCAPDKITQLMREYGHTTQPPSIWLYAPNDLYWGAEPPKQWHTAFNNAAKANHNSSPSTLVQTPPIGSDGHSLQRAGTAHWGPPLAAWLRTNKL